MTTNLSSWSPWNIVVSGSLWFHHGVDPLGWTKAPDQDVTRLGLVGMFPTKQTYHPHSHSISRASIVVWSLAGEIVKPMSQGFDPLAKEVGGRRRRRLKGNRPSPSYPRPLECYRLVARIWTRDFWDRSAALQEFRLWPCDRATLLRFLKVGWPIFKILHAWPWPISAWIWSNMRSEVGHWRSPCQESKTDWEVIEDADCPGQENVAQAGMSWLGFCGRYSSHQWCGFLRWSDFYKLAFQMNLKPGLHSFPSAWQRQADTTDIDTLKKACETQLKRYSADEGGGWMCAAKETSSHRE